MAKARPRSDLPRTVEEFDRWNRNQPERWEFIAGVPVRLESCVNGVYFKCRRAIW